MFTVFLFYKEKERLRGEGCVGVDIPWKFCRTIGPLTLHSQETVEITICNTASNRDFKVYGGMRRRCIMRPGLNGVLITQHVRSYPGQLGAATFELPLIIRKGFHG